MLNCPKCTERISDTLTSCPYCDQDLIEASSPKPPRLQETQAETVQDEANQEVFDENPDHLGCPKCGHSEMEKTEIYKFFIGFALVLLIGYPILLGTDENDRSMIGFTMIAASLTVYYNWKRKCRKCGYAIGTIDKIQTVVFMQSEYYLNWRERRRKKEEASRKEEETHRKE